MFRGREMEHIDVGMNVVRQALEDLSGVGRADDEPKLNGRFIIVSVSPLPLNQHVLKYNSEEEAKEEVHEEDDVDFASEDDEQEEKKVLEKSSS